jgi:hypothetical protein
MDIEHGSKLKQESAARDKTLLQRDRGQRRAE